MKTSLKGFTASLVLLLLGTNLITGQINSQAKQVSKASLAGQAGQANQTDNTEFKLTKTINLNGESEKVEIIIPVAEGKIGLTIKISSVIVGGELTIEVYDPTGEKMGNYSVGSQNSIKIVGKTYNPTQSDAISGQITKSVLFPNIGNWKINVIPKNAKGSIDLESIQSSLKR